MIRVRPLFVAALAVAAAILPGCADTSIGPTIRADAETVDSRSQRPTQATWVKRQNAQLSAEGKPLEAPGSHTLNIAGPSSNIVEIGDSGISQAGSGPAGQAIRLTQPDGTRIDAFSQTNLRASKKETVDPGGNKLVEISFDSDSATATRADAERITAAMPAFLSLDEAQRARRLEVIQAQRDVWKQALDTAIPGLFDAVVKALGG